MFIFFKILKKNFFSKIIFYKIFCLNYIYSFNNFPINGGMGNMVIDFFGNEIKNKIKNSIEKFKFDSKLNYSNKSSIKNINSIEFNDYNNTYIKISLNKNYVDNIIFNKNINNYQYGIFDKEKYIFSKNLLKKIKFLKENKNEEDLQKIKYEDILDEVTSFVEEKSLDFCFEIYSYLEDQILIGIKKIKLVEPFLEEEVDKILKNKNCFNICLFFNCFNIDFNLRYKSFLINFNFIFFENENINININLLFTFVQKFLFPKIYDLKEKKYNNIISYKVYENLENFKKFFLKTFLNLNIKLNYININWLTFINFLKKYKDISLYDFLKKFNIDSSQEIKYMDINEIKKELKIQKLQIKFEKKNKKTSSYVFGIVFNGDITDLNKNLFFKIFFEISFSFSKFLSIYIKYKTIKNSFSSDDFFFFNPFLFIDSNQNNLKIPDLNISLVFNYKYDFSKKENDEICFM